MIANSPNVCCGPHPPITNPKYRGPAVAAGVCHVTTIVRPLQRPKAVRAALDVEVSDRSTSRWINGPYRLRFDRLKRSASLKVYRDGHPHGREQAVFGHNA